MVEGFVSARAKIIYRVIACILLLSSCGGGGGSSAAKSGSSSSNSTSSSSSTSSNSSSSSSSSSSSGNGALERVNNTTCIAPENPNTGTGTISTESVFTGLGNLQAIAGLMQAPGDDEHFYMFDLYGNVFRFDDTPSVNSKELVLDIDSRVRTTFEMGLLGLAFHPNFATNGEFFVHYNDERNSGATTISRFTYSGTLPVSPDTEEIILTVPQPAGNHNGGTINFGPDGYLYIGLGDGGGSNDEHGNGQNPNSLLGSILRIDVDGEAPYEVPPNNPFISNSEFRPEIYAWGLRNPWRWNFDPQNGNLWVADVGQGEYEEVNIISAGNNLGWPIMEGNHCFRANSCDMSGLTLPVAEYNHDNGNCSITGGFVYRGSAIPSLQGSYIYGDYCTGSLRRTWPNNNTWESEELDVLGLNIVSFGSDADGELYVLRMWSSPNIYKIIQSSGSGDSNIPTTISESGCFSSTQEKTLAPGVVPFDVRSKLWSDGARKERHFAIPDGQTVSLEADGDFHFPVGSVLIKNFMDGNTWLETRLFMHHATGWAGYSYEWLPDGSDANLLSGAKTIDTGNFVHSFPSSGECLQCHTGAAGSSLGLEAGQLDWDLTYPVSGLTENQADALASAGYIATSPTSDQRPYLPALDDDTATLEQRARSYLHSNCAGCHRPGGPGNLVDLRIQTALTDTGACDQIPNAGNMMIENARIIAPGDAQRSVLYTRMRDLGEYRMPPIGSLIEDTSATTLIANWINSLSGCS